MHAGMDGYVCICMYGCVEDGLHAEQHLHLQHALDDMGLVLPTRPDVAEEQVEAHAAAERQYRRLPRLIEPYDADEPVVPNLPEANNAKHCETAKESADDGDGNLILGREAGQLERQPH